MDKDTATRTPKEIVETLDALKVPVALDNVEALLRELASALTGEDDLAVGRWREAAVQALTGKLRAPARLVDRALAPLGGSAENEELQGQAVEPFVPEPWQEPVDGADLLLELVTVIQRYVVLGQSAAIAVVLWVLHTHALDAAWFTPRLAITSPTKRCGKTLLLEILEHLGCKALNVANITAAALFRAVEKFRPTLLVDEADTFLVDKEELRGVLNSGHRRNGTVVRTVGDKHEVRVFSTYAAVAIAMIGRLPDTLADRSIPVSLRRRRREEKVRRFRADRVRELEVLCRKATRWALDSLVDLKEADPEVPPELHDRAADNWRPLLAIADAAGGDWPARARQAAQELSGAAPAEEDESVGTLLLGDLRTIFEETGEPALFTQLILYSLSERDDRPWAEWKADKPLTGVQLAKLLRPFCIRPKQIRIGKESKKGYEQAWFEDAFARYLPPLEPKQAEHANGINDLRAESTRNTEAAVSSAESTEVVENKGDASDVADVSGPDGEPGEDTPLRGQLDGAGSCAAAEDLLTV
jgi:putative DNA primase/helicase